MPAALSTAAVMVTLSATVMTRALASILPEDANCLVPLDLIPLPPWKTYRTSHQRQVERQNKWKSKEEVYAQALVLATMLIATKRTKAKENSHTMSSVIIQVEREFKACGYVVSLSSKTVNHYIRNNMASTPPLSRG